VKDSKGVTDDERGESTEEGIGRGESDDDDEIDDDDDDEPETEMRLTERSRQLVPSKVTSKVTVMQFS